MQIKSCLVFFFIIWQTATCICQTSSNTTTLDLLLKQVAEEHSVSIIYNAQEIDASRVTEANYSQLSLELLLKEIATNHQLILSKEGQIYLLTKAPSYTLHGYVVDSLTGERLPYVYLSMQPGSLLLSSSVDGYYHTEVPEGSYQLTLSYLGRPPTKVSVGITGDTQLDVSINTLSERPEVTIDEDKVDLPLGNKSNYSHQDLMTIARKTPTLGGSNDLLQTIKMQPGIQSGAGGIGGLFVRGGSNDQNLILVDGVEIFNPSHALGLTSIFTPETTKDLKVYKDGFNPKYGDRSSSVIDIQLKEGNTKKAQFTAGINPQDGFLKAELPLPKENSSIFGYVRSTSTGHKFDDIISQSLFLDSNTNSSTAYLDIILKSKWQFNKNHSLYLTYLRTKDRTMGSLAETGEDFDFYYETRLSWGNEVISGQLKSILSNDLYLTTSLSYNKYFSQYGSLYEDFDVELDIDDFYFYEVGSDNSNLEFKLQLDYYINNALSLQVGGGVSRKSFAPDINEINEDSEEFAEFEDPLFDDLEGIDDGISFQTWKVYQHANLLYSSPAVEATLGLRSTYFRSIEDNYYDLQPRLRLDWHIDDQLSFIGSYSKTVQYIHLLSASELQLPRDLWYPSFEDLKPERTTQLSIGLRYSRSPRWSYLISAFSNNTDGRAFSTLDIIDGAYVIQAFDVISGSAKSKGVEVSGHFQSSRFASSISYTWASSEREYDLINEGQRYSFQFDRRHELKGSITYDLLDQLTLGCNLYLASGHPLLVTTGLDLDQGLNIIDVDPSGSKHVTRESWKHRVDLSIAYTKKAKQLEHFLKLNIYNASSVSIPLYYELIDDVEISPQFSLPLVPSIAYQIKF